MRNKPSFRFQDEAEDEEDEKRDLYDVGVDVKRPLMGKSLSRLFSSDNILDETLLKVGWGRYQLLLLVVGSITAMFVATSFSPPTFLSGNKSWLHNAGLDSLDVSIWISAGSIGGLANIIIVYLADLYGRRKVLIYTSLFAAVINFCTAFADDFWILILQQALTVGPMEAVASLSIVLLLEFTDTTVRGRAGLAMAVITTWNHAVMSISAYAVMRGTYPPQAAEQFFTFTTPMASWRYLYLVASVPVFCVLIFFVFLPYESPRYLLKTGKYREALDVVLGVIKRNKVHLYEDEIPTLEQFRLASDQLVDESNDELNWGVRSMWREFWSIPDTKYLLIATVCLFCTEWSFNGFIGLFLSKTGLPVYLILIFGSTVGPIPALFVVWCTVDRLSFGRIRYFQFFYILYTLAFFGMLCFLSAKAYLVFFTIWMFAFVPAESILLFYIPEIYPTRLRSFASGVFLCVPNILQFVLNFVAAYTVNGNPRIFVAVYAGMSLIGVLASLKLKTDMTREPMY